MTPRMLSIMLLSGTALTAVTWAIARARRKTPEQLEKMRREHIQEHGRITDGTVIDTQELSHGEGENARESQLVIYQYDVGGVSYEASQDVTTLRHYVDLHNCRIGLPASVKYDPQNPGNSIVIAESWSGLRL